MYDSILLPVDGSSGAAEALHHAGEIAHRMAATIELLYVADTSRDSVTVVETDLVDALVTEGESIVENAAETLQTLGVEHTTDVVQGTPAPTIVEYADRYGHDLIVMPTHGRTGLARYLLGSVTEKVVRLSSVPVLTVRLDADEPLTFPYERILVPTDGSSAAMAAAHHGLDLAASLEAAVHVISVVDDQSFGPDVRSTVVEEELTGIAETAVDDVVAAVEQRDVSELHRHIEHGRPAATILDTIGSTDSHAVVMGTTGRRGIDRILLGSVTEKTVRSAAVPVITVAGE
ncbi:MAG: universal stress protein [Halobacteriales archaeon]